jgi:RNase H-like domain found in reverse transcriptase/Reverse transcriptase (RNA-dependent DNA polymerase)/Integrase core domain/Integrase zinc binding domain
LNSNTCWLRTVNGQPLQVMGQINVTAVIKNTEYRLSLIIIKSEKAFTTLIGRNWLDVIIPDWRDNFMSVFDEVNKIGSQDPEVEVFLKSLKDKYRNVFQTDNKSTINKFEISIRLKENVKPVFKKAYNIPFALKDKVKQKLEEMVNDNIIYPIRHSPWASPIVCVEKKNKVIRISTDFKHTVNKAIDVDKYPLPLIDDIFITLADGRFFTVIDLSGAYQQLKIAKPSEEIFTINTPFGLYRYTRLTYGIASAPAIFQRTMEEILRNIPRTCVYLDDILVSGRNLEESMQLVETVIQRLATYNVKINTEKSHFFQKKVLYLGHQIDKTGIRPIQSKINEIVNCPAPKNVKDVRAYTGVLNYYHRFMPNLSTVLQPLYELLHTQKKFIWGEPQQRSFKHSKELLQKSPVLVPYDPRKETIVAADASPYGLGGVLSQIYDEGERPVLFVSCTLSAAERNYSQLEKEGLALIFSVKKFHRFIYGRPFTLYTDHKPLKMIFSPDKAIPTLAASRIQRWALILSTYKYDIKYKKGSEMTVPDFLSRNPEAESSGVNDEIAAITELDNIPLCYKTIAQQSEEDSVLSRVIEYTQKGWPNFVKGNQITAYWSRRHELSMQNSCLIWNRRVIVPESMQAYVLQLLHEEHIGIVRTKMLARSLCWWPTIDKDIESFGQNCTACALNSRRPNKDCFSAWPKSSRSFERVHLDFFCLYGNYFLIVIDSFSKWMEIALMKRTTAQDVICELRSIFARFGLPSTVVTDNGPPFTSHELETFLQSNAIDHPPIPPYHPESNGIAERAVETCKKSLKISLKVSNTTAEIRKKLDNFLLKYRNTPTTTTGLSPAELVLQHKPRTLLQILIPPKTHSMSAEQHVQTESDVQPKKPATTTKKVPSKPQPPNNTIPRSKIYFDGEKVIVMLKPKQVGVPGRILKSIGHNTYLVNVNNAVKLIHADQLKKSLLDEILHPGMSILPTFSSEVQQTELQKPTPRLSLTSAPTGSSGESNNTPASKTMETTEPNRKSSRITKQPERFGYTNFK